MQVGSEKEAVIDDTSTGAASPIRSGRDGDRTAEASPIQQGTYTGIAAESPASPETRLKLLEASHERLVKRYSKQELRVQSQDLNIRMLERRLERAVGDAALAEQRLAEHQACFEAVTKNAAAVDAIQERVRGMEEALAEHTTRLVGCEKLSEVRKVASLWVFCGMMPGALH